MLKIVKWNQSAISVCITLILMFSCLSASARAEESASSSDQALSAAGNVCMIGDTGYESLDAALGAVKSGETKTITLLQDINYNKGIYVESRNITFGLQGHTLNVNNNIGDGLEVKSGGSVATTGSGKLNVTGASYAIIVHSEGQVQITGNAQGGYYGASVIGSGSSATINGSATGILNQDSIGANASDGGQVQIAGNAQGCERGAKSDGTNSQVTVGGNATATSKNTGAEALNGGHIHVAGNVQGIEYGVLAGGTNSLVTVGGNAAASSNGSVGAIANNGGQVQVSGNVQGRGFGVYASTDATVTVGGNATATGANGVGAGAYQKSTITIGGVITSDTDIYINAGAVTKTADQKEALTTKTGYYTYTDDGTNTVWVIVPPSEAVCRIGSLYCPTLDDALAAVKDGEAKTITLMKDITYDKGIEITDKSVTFVLQGYTLNLHASNGIALKIGSKGIVNTSGSGKFNVTSDNYIGVEAHDGGQINITGDVNGAAIGVAASGAGTSIVINGNIAGDTGAWVQNQGSITINGVISAANYIQVGNAAKTADDTTIPTTKMGYYTYKDGTSTVWVYSGQPQTNVISVSKPVSGDTWITGNKQDIKWSYSGKIDKVVIQLFKDGALYQNIATTTAKKKKYSWNIPSTIENGTYRLRVASTTDDIIYGISNEFIISAPFTSITMTNPSGEQSWETGSKQTIKWSYEGKIKRVNIQLLQLDDEVVGSVTSKGKSYKWTIPENLAAGTYRIKIVNAANENVYAISENITVSAPVTSVTLTSPSTGGSWETDSKQTIRWSYQGKVNKVNIFLMQDDEMIKTITSASAKKKSYKWTVPEDLDGTYQIKIVNAANDEVYDTSDSITIAAPVTTLNLISPVEGLAWKLNKKQTIKWTYTGAPGKVKVSLYKGDDLIKEIGSYTCKRGKTSGSCKYTPPKTLEAGDDYNIIISSTNHPDVTDESGEFSIE